MRYRLFQYPLPAPPELEDLNTFLGTQRVATVTQHLVQTAGGALLVFVVETVASSLAGPSGPAVPKVDYRDQLNTEQFAVFSRLRVERKRWAEVEELPIGALTSQYLGNFYLDSFDHWVKQTRHVRHYLRYMDDMLFLDSRDTLDAVRREAPAVLEGLGLKIKHDGILNRCELGVPYLGFVLYPDRTRLNRQGRRRLRRRVKDIERRWFEGQITEEALQTRGEALFAHVCFGDDLNWRRMVTRFSRFGETQEPDPRPAGRLVEQHRQELPLGVSQQEQAG